ncbi:TetR family transcriptional regulator [Ruegeria conchae]|uniref:TetR family transcriptional regulator n=1 Tax=Ruegeria conchae TaxID=981384 RepID=UPI002882FE6B|nr:TetR family transcriptional regulator [Ruegeria conchae]
MITQGRKFTRQSAESRHEALIQATLDLIAEIGLHGATACEIAARANVTQGLIRHYF